MRHYAGQLLRPQLLLSLWLLLPLPQLVRSLLLLLLPPLFQVVQRRACKVPACSASCCRCRRCCSLDWVAKESRMEGSSGHGTVWLICPLPHMLPVLPPLLGGVGRLLGRVALCCRLQCRPCLWLRPACSFTSVACRPAQPSTIQVIGLRLAPPLAALRCLLLPRWRLLDRQRPPLGPALLRRRRLLVRRLRLCSVLPVLLLPLLLHLLHVLLPLLLRWRGTSCWRLWLIQRQIHLIPSCTCRLLHLQCLPCLHLLLLQLGCTQCPAWLVLLPPGPLLLLRCCLLSLLRSWVEVHAVQLLR